MTEQLAAAKEHQSTLSTRVREIRLKRRTETGNANIAPALIGFLLTNNIKSASADMQEKILDALGRGAISSPNYVLVGKAALRSTRLEPLQRFPDNHLISESVRGVLAITPEEKKSVESAFAQAYEGIAAWAKSNVQREGPPGNMIVRYTIPADQDFEHASTESLFATIYEILGQERGELMRGYFDPARVHEDGAIGDRTNILEVYRTGKSNLGYRAGWKWNDSNAVNTDPAPIKPGDFWTAFYFVSIGLTGFTAREFQRTEPVDILFRPRPNPGHRGLFLRAASRRLAIAASRVSFENSARPLHLR